jgi:hypothetical protein
LTAVESIPNFPRYGDQVPVRVGAAALALLLVLCDLCTSSILNLRLGWVSGGPGTPLLWITGQLGLVAGVMSLARATVPRERNDWQAAARSRRVGALQGV